MDPQYVEIAARENRWNPYCRDHLQRDQMEATLWTSLPERTEIGASYSDYVL